MPDAFLWIYEDHGRDLALVRGRGVSTALESAGITATSKWSVTARGYVMPLDAVPDLCAMADYHSIPHRVREVTS